MKQLAILLALIFVSFLAVAGFILYTGSSLSSAALHQIGVPPADLLVEPIEFNGIKGWYIPGTPKAPCVILMHGLRADRRSMIDRARLLHTEGYATLLFDFQAHGESPGEHLTFGYLEASNAHDAVTVARTRLKCTQIGAIGQSLGGAAALLGDKPFDVDAMVIESVYPNIENAISNRLKIRLGEHGRLFTPLLTLQIKYRMGIDPQKLRPIDAIHSFNKPLMVMAGEDDRHTTLSEAKALFSAANEPKEFWAVPGAQHVDLYHFAPELYRKHLVSFLTRYLPRQ